MPQAPESRVTPPMSEQLDIDMKEEELHDQESIVD